MGEGSTSSDDVEVDADGGGEGGEALGRHDLVGGEVGLSRLDLFSRNAGTASPLTVMVMTV